MPRLAHPFSSAQAVEERARLIEKQGYTVSADLLRYAFVDPDPSEAEAETNEPYKPTDWGEVGRKIKERAERVLEDGGATTRPAPGEIAPSVIEDEPPEIEDELLVCDDCSAPIVWDEEIQDYQHVGVPNALHPVCFLESGPRISTMPEEELNRALRKASQDVLDELTRAIALIGEAINRLSGS